MPIILVIPAFFVAGLGIKFIDAAYDDNTFSRNFALPLAIVVGLLLGASMIVEHTLFIIASSVMLGVFLTGKLDNIPFRVLVFISVAMSILALRAPFLATRSDWYIFFWFCHWVSH